MKDLIFLDTETTSADTKIARMIQLGFKRLPRETFLTNNDYKKWKDEGIDNLFYKNPCEIEIGAMATHHITPEKLAEYPLMDDLSRDSIKDSLMDSFIVAHNAKFDIDILENEGIKDLQYIDTLKVAAYFFDLESYGLQWLRYYYKIYNVPYKGDAHDAAFDVACLIEVFEALVERIIDLKYPDNMQPFNPAQHSERKEKLVEFMVEISKLPKKLRRWPNFGKHANKDFSDIPKDYLQWAINKMDDEEIIHACKFHLDYRKSKNIPG